MYGKNIGIVIFDIKGFFVMVSRFDQGGGDPRRARSSTSIVALGRRGFEPGKGWP